MSNRLAQSSSPYLRQHQDNPVDWYPWCDEAFAKSREEDKPIFLSVGYSACHWCHVMERESFESEEIAALLNRHFVSVKVDREERPDVDQIYMQAVQLLTGSGGWPMSVFMTADGKPFYGGTYWPPDSRQGMPGFGQVLLAIINAWENKREQIESQTDQILEHLQESCRGSEPADELDPQWIEQAVQWLVDHHDQQWGGFGGAPKFPHAMDLSLLTEVVTVSTHQTAQDAVQHTLRRMQQGGIFDHLGGGFARYSVDRQWLVPHFEKMLYDNALLAAVYGDAYRQWKDESFADTLKHTLDYITRDMTNGQGGYHSTEDADSEGVEGKFYVWSNEEIRTLLPERGDLFAEFYGVKPAGNFEGANILNVSQPLPEFASAKGIAHDQLRHDFEVDRNVLLEHRASRTRPGLDDKVILSWNALMISGMVAGYRALGNLKYLDSARGALAFLVENMRRPDGSFFHTWREGTASVDAFLDDYAYLLVAVTDLMQVECTSEYVELVSDIAKRLLAGFADPHADGFYFTARTHEALVARNKDLADSSVPSGNAMAATGLLTLARLTDRDDYREAAQSALRAASGVMASAPQAAGQALRTLLRYSNASTEYVFVEGTDSEQFEQLRRRVLNRYDPLSVALCVRNNQLKDLSPRLPLLQGRETENGEATLWVCQAGTCRTPLSGTELVKFLDGP